MGNTAVVLSTAKLHPMIFQPKVSRRKPASDGPVRTPADIPQLSNEKACPYVPAVPLISGISSVIFPTANARSTANGDIVIENAKPDEM